MRIKIIPYDKLQTLKYNIPSMIPKYREKDAKWITDYFNEDPFVETSISCPEFDLKVSVNPKDDFENVKITYDALKDVISDSIAADERLWVGMTLNKFWDYSTLRWSQVDWSANGIQERLFFKSTGRRALTRNAISRLWWIGRLTYDKNNVDHYKYTKFVCSNQRFIVDILERNASNNIDLIKPCIDAIMDYETSNPTQKVDSEKLREVQKYLNILGGVYILDCLDYQFLYKKISTKIASLFA